MAPMLGVDDRNRRSCALSGDLLRMQLETLSDWLPVLFAAAIEEVVFRHWLPRRLAALMTAQRLSIAQRAMLAGGMAQVSFAAAHLASRSVQSGAHLQAKTVMEHFVFGLILLLLLRATGGIGVPIAAHCAYNGRLSTGSQRVLEYRPLIATIAILGCFVAVCLFRLLRRTHVPRSAPLLSVTSVDATGTTLTSKRGKRDEEAHHGSYRAGMRHVDSRHDELY